MEQERNIELPHKTLKVEPKIAVFKCNFVILT